jgi:hypothetical protein
VEFGKIAEVPGIYGNKNISQVGKLGTGTFVKI